MSENDELKEALLTEANDHLLLIENNILELESDPDNYEQETINSLFRSMHTIKGSSSFFPDFKKITELSHALEDIFGMIREKKLILTKAILQSIFTGIDKLKIMLTEPDTITKVDIREQVGHFKQLLASPNNFNGEIKSDTINNISDKTEKIEETSVLNEISDVTEEKNADEIFIYDIKLDLFLECENKNRTIIELFDDIKQTGNLINLKYLNSEINTGNNAIFENKLSFNLIIETIIDDPDLLIQGLDISPYTIDKKPKIQNNINKTVEYTNEILKENKPILNPGDTSAVNNISDDAILENKLGNTSGVIKMGVNGSSTSANPASINTSFSVSLI